MVTFRKAFKIFIVLICCGSAKILANRVYLTNVKCDTHDENFSTVEECRLSVVKRNLNALTIRVKLLQPPVDNVTLDAKFMKKSNGYNPYMVQLKIDCCKFLKQKDNPLLLFFWRILEPYTNANHTCPYNHDVILQDFSIDHSIATIAPVPSGDYGVFLSFSSINIKRVNIEVYFRYEEGQ